MDIFHDKTARPMLIGPTEAPFDDEGYLFELKLDGLRVLAYLDENETVLTNRHGRTVSQRFPELSEIHKQVHGPCILDGEIICTTDGKPDFELVKSRNLMKDPLRIQVAAKQNPASLVVFDILYTEGKQITSLPLTQRLEALHTAVDTESERLSLSRTVAEQGRALFSQARVHGLEGVVAKKLTSSYEMGKRTRNWSKIKNTQDDDFVVCGYIKQADYVASLILGQYAEGGPLEYMGHVTLALSSEDFARIENQPRAAKPPLLGPLPPGNENVIWLEPTLVCTVQFMARGTAGSVRHPVYKGLRADKAPSEAVWQPGEGV